MPKVEIPEVRGDGRPIRDFPVELSNAIRREFPDLEELFHAVATRIGDASRDEASHA